MNAGTSESKELNPADMDVEIRVSDEAGQQFAADVVPQPDTTDPEAEAADMADQDSELGPALARNGIELQGETTAQLERYCRLLWDWNTRLNLTRHLTFEAFVTRDLLDTLNLSQHIDKGIRVLDMGSGGGVPGIPLAILRPDLKISLSDSMTRKAAVLQSMVQTMNIKVAVHSDRAENILKRHHFHTATARAVAPLSKLLTWFASGWKSVNQMLLIKGPRFQEELAEAEASGLMKRLEAEILTSWSTPGRDGRSVLVRIRPKKSGGLKATDSRSSG